MCCILVFNQVLYVTAVKKYYELPLFYSCCASCKKKKKKKKGLGVGVKKWEKQEVKSRDHTENANIPLSIHFYGAHSVFHSMCENEMQSSCSLKYQWIKWP